MPHQLGFFISPFGIYYQGHSAGCLLYWDLGPGGFCSRGFASQSTSALSWPAGLYVLVLLPVWFNISATMTYVVKWHEVHLWNVSVFQTAPLSNLASFSGS